MTDTAPHVIGTGYAHQIPHIQLLDMRVLRADREAAIMLLPWRDELVGNPETGVMHGGAVTTLIDSVGGLAVLARMDKPGPIATLDLRIDYLKPATPGEDLIARATIFRMSRQIAFTRIAAWHEHEHDPVAAAQATFMLKGSGGGLAADRPAS